MKYIKKSETRRMRMIARFPMPFVDRATIPSWWLHWLAGQGSTPNHLVQSLAMAAAKSGQMLFEWNYHVHGALPWMQFFYDWRFGDVLNNGELGIVLCRGAESQKAIAADGQVLWHYTNGSAGFTTVRYDSNFALWDIDDDGRTELICLRVVEGLLRICIVDAATGSVKRCAPIPDMQNEPKDVRASIIVADVSGAGYASDIVLSWDYYSVAAFNCSLQLVWYRYLQHEFSRKHRTMGHTPYPYDIDACGRSEIFAGSCLLNCDGSTRWVCPDLPSLCRFNHADSVKIVQLDEHEGPCVLMSTGAYCFDTGGSLLWGDHEMSEGQALRTGKLTNSIGGQQIAVYEACSRHIPNQPDILKVLDKSGNLLWKTQIKGPDMQEGGFGLWTGNWTGSDTDCVFINDETNVLVFDGEGKTISSFPGHLIEVITSPFHPACAVVVDKIAPGFELQFYTHDRQAFVRKPTWPYRVSPDLSRANSTRY